MPLDRYAHIGRVVFEEPWAIRPETFAQIVDLVQLRQAGITLTRADVEARIGGEGRDRPETAIVEGVGIIQCFGVIAQRMNLFASISGGTSTEQMTAEFRALRDDPKVKAILFAIDSPGGTVYGVEELASEIRASRGLKPIVASANALAASAAYWIGSAADRFTVTPSGDVGSVGVLSAHTDLSAAAEKAGIKTSYIAAGLYKTEGHPFAPLSDEAIAFRQTRVNAVHDRMVTAIAAGRGVSEAAVRASFGQGRVLGARPALDAGMVDAIEPFDETLAALVARPAAVAPAPRRTLAESPSEPFAVALGGRPRRMPESYWRALMESHL